MWEYWIIAGTITFIIAMSIWRHQSGHIKQQVEGIKHQPFKATDVNSTQSPTPSEESPFVMDSVVTITPVTKNETALSALPKSDTSFKTAKTSKTDSIFETMAKAAPQTTFEDESQIIVNQKIDVHVPKVEFQHQYDSAFYDAERGSFCFPRFPHLEHFMIKIIDKTPYKTIAGLGRKQSQHHYSLSQFESTFKSSDLQLEVEPLSALFSKNPNNILGKNEFLKGNWQLICDLLRTQSAYRPASFGQPLAKEDALPYVKVYAKLHDQLLKNGLIEELDLRDENMRKEYINALSVPEIKVLCKEAKIAVGKRLKDELVAELQKVANQLTLPKAAIPSTFFFEFINHLFDKYIEDMAQNLNRFHPMYVHAAWQAARKGALDEKLFALSHKLEALQEE